MKKTYAKAVKFCLSSLMTMGILLTAGYGFHSVVVYASTVSEPNIITHTVSNESNESNENNYEIIMLSSEELLARAAQSPSYHDTRSATVLPTRRLTETELTAWIEEYNSLGGINAFELEVVRLINEVRASYGLQPWAINPQLMMAARFHSQEMIDLRYFSHRSEIYGRSTNRAEMFGHVNIQEHVFGVGENLSTGRESAEAVVNAWLNSPGHRAALLGELGEATLSIGVGRSGHITTAKFGS